MKQTKIFYGNQYVGSMYCGKTKFQVFMYKLKRLTIKAIAVIIALDVIGWAGVAGYHYAKGSILPITVYAESKPITTSTPVMERIAQCESGNNHFDPKTKQVLMRPNTNKTVDVGKYQINSMWFKKATELGLDITKETDNEKMAYWIYENRGTTDWNASKACWQK